MTLLYLGDHRLRLRRATWFDHGIKPSRRSLTGHRPVRRWEVTFDRGLALGTGGSRSFTLAVIIAIWRTYASALYQRRLRKADEKRQAVR